MSESSFIGIIHNVSLLLAIIIVFNSTSLRWKTEKLSWRQCVLGVIIGLIAVAVMMSPWVYLPGLVFDTRSILLCITGLYFGIVPTLIALIMTVIFRYTQGGAGTWMGICVIISSCAIGLIWRHYRRTKLAKLSWFELYLFGIAVHIAMLMMVVFLPEDMVFKTLHNIYLPVITIYPLGTAFLGIMLSKKMRDDSLSDQIKESEVKFKIIANNTYDWEYWIDINGKFIFCSPSCEKITGHTPDEYYNNPALLTEIIHPEDCDKYCEHNKINSDDGKQLDYRIIMPDKTVRWVGQVHMPVWENGEYLGIRASIRDITDRKEMEIERARIEQQMQQTQKMESLGVLAGGIAHDFNNILMAVLGYAELTQMSISELSPAKPHIQQIVIAAHRAAELCQQMLAYTGKASLTNTKVNIGDLVSEMTHLLKASISKKAILNLHVDKMTPLVNADPSQIRQVVMNLIINASDAIGDRSGVVSVSVGSINCDSEYLKTTELVDNLTPGLYTYIEIADTGCGIDAEMMNRIFEPFYSTKFTGRGLGLAASLGIVRAHKGAIKVYSEIAKGTTFKILLPALNADEIIEEKNTINIEQQWKGEGKILLADDEESIRNVASDVLELLGYSVITACDGREAINIYAEKYQEINVIILDMTMPHVDGAGAFKEIRLINPEAKVLLASGYSKDDIGARFAGKGLTGVLQKPFTINTLREALKSIETSE